MPEVLGCSRGALRTALAAPETYSTLTRLPLPYRVTPEKGISLIRLIAERLKPTSLDPGEYLTALEAASSSGIVGGALYDFLIYRCALKANAVTLYTWNLRHYSRFSAEISRLPE